MALLTKTYWKWTAAHDEVDYALHSTFPELIPEADFELIEKNENTVRLRSRTQKNLSIFVKNSRIVRKNYQGGGFVGKLNIEKDFQDKVEASLSAVLSPCAEEDPCDKLVLCYIDGILAAAILTA